MMRFSALILVPVLALSLSAARAASLPDTGQALCDNGSNVLAACTSGNTGDTATYPRQDGRFGRDASKTAGTLTKIGGGAAGFDYTKVCNSGEPQNTGSCPANPALGAGANDWACTRDNITGLTWEVKVNDETHLRHWSWEYTWYSSNGSTNGGNAGTPDTGFGVGSDNCLDTSRCDTEKFAADVNTAALCGFSDWRMPTQRELLTLVHFGTQTPSIDAIYFPNTNVSDAFWSGSSYVPNPAGAWVVDFSTGETAAGTKSGTNYVRLVRGGQF
jgi:hypothetical protein